MGSIEYSSEDGLLFGKIQGIMSLISYEGKSGKELEKDFQTAIDEYLEDCKKSNSIPEQAFKGSFNVRVNPSIHQKIYLAAKKSKTSLNNFVTQALLEKLEG
ncbi:MAG: type II toxin-antitoxin system HicB family antitoxin [Saprospiraceae bacterium]